VPTFTLGFNSHYETAFSSLLGMIPTSSGVYQFALNLQPLVACLFSDREPWRDDVLARRARILFVEGCDFLARKGRRDLCRNGKMQANDAYGTVCFGIAKSVVREGGKLDSIGPFFQNSCKTGGVALEVVPVSQSFPPVFSDVGEERPQRLIEQVSFAHRFRSLM
jgi:hypothetical protein